MTRINDGGDGGRRSLLRAKHPSVYVVIVAAVAVVVFLNLVGREPLQIEVIDVQGKYGPDFYVWPQWQAGWPLTCGWQHSETLVDPTKGTWESVPYWTFAFWPILANLLIGGGLVAAAGWSYLAWRRRGGKLGQFRLAWLFVICAGASALAAYLVSHRKEYLLQRAVLDRLEDHAQVKGYTRNSSLVWHSEGPKSLVALLPDSVDWIFERVADLDISDLDGTEIELASELPDLRVVRIGHCSQAQLRTLEHLPRLEALVVFNLSGGQIATPEGFLEPAPFVLPPLRNLRGLSVNESYYAGGGLEHLDSLERAYLWECELDDAAVAKLAGLKRLRQLELGSSSLTNVGMQKLGDLKGLEKLLTCCTFKDDEKLSVEAVSAIATLPRLKKLKLIYYNSGPATLKPLAGVKNLEELYVEGGGDLDVAEYHYLKRHLPNCEINIDGHILK